MYTKGDINKIIDSVMHPLARQHPFFEFIDGLLHALNERNPEESVAKFIRYNLPKLLYGRR